MEKIVLYSVKHATDSLYQLPLGMTLKEAKGFMREYFPNGEVSLIARVYEQTMEVNLDTNHA